MHILINGSFWTEPNTGSGQYVHGLLRCLPQVAPQHRYTLVLPAVAGPGQPPPPGVSVLPIRTPFDGRSANFAKLWFEQIGMAHAARLVQQATRRTQPVLVHVPYFAPPLRCPVPLITTVGDIIPLLLPEYRGGLHVRAYMALVCRAVWRSAHILTFSACSRADIVAHLGMPPERITPVLLAPSERYQPGDPQQARAEVAARYGLHEPFIYYVGGLDARKNVTTLIRAFALLCRQGGPTATLAIAGRPLGQDRRLFPDLDELISELGLDALVRRFEVPFADGPLLYQACTVFAFPSRYEGFGLPPLEAMACGAPVLVSAASSLPEVVGTAAIVVPPDDVASWALALDRLLRDAALRDSLREQGFAQVARFSWQRVARETVQVYERVAEAVG